MSQQLMIPAIQKEVDAGKELELLSNLRLYPGKPFLMCRPNVGENPQSGLDHLRQGVHVAYFGNPGLQNGYLVVGLNSKNR